MYKKCFREKMKVYFGERLADCCGVKNVVTSSLSVVENGLVTWERDRIGSANREGSLLLHQTRRKPRNLLASLENMKK